MPREQRGVEEVEDGEGEAEDEKKRNCLYVAEPRTST